MLSKNEAIELLRKRNFTKAQFREIAAAFSDATGIVQPNLAQRAAGKIVQIADQLAPLTLVVRPSAYKLLDDEYKVPRGPANVRRQPKGLIP